MKNSVRSVKQFGGYLKKTRGGLHQPPCLGEGQDNQLGAVFGSRLARSAWLTSEDDQREGVLDVAAGDGLDVRAVQVGVLHVVQQGVAPVQPVAVVVDAESVRPAQQHVLEHHHVAAVGVRSADVGRTVPLREKDVAEGKGQGQGEGQNSRMVVL